MVKRSGRERDDLAARVAGSGGGRVDAGGAVKAGEDGGSGGDSGGGGKGDPGGEPMQGHSGSHVHFDIPGSGGRKEVVTSVAEAREGGHGGSQAPRRPPTSQSAVPGGGGVAPGNAAAVFGHPATFAPSTTAKEKEVG